MITTRLNRQNLILSAIALTATVFVSACAPSQAPVISPISQVPPPKFDGGSQNKITVSTQKFSVTGTCDVKIEGLQYSTDLKTWTDLATGCAKDGTFKITGNVIRTLNLYARAKLKLAVSDPAVVEIDFVPPATSPTLQFVSASGSKDDALPSAVGVLGHSFTGKATSNDKITVRSYLPGMVYGGP